MGLYDIIKVEHLLPGFRSLEEQNRLEFQTKSFPWESLLETYIITNKGQLYRENWDMRWNEEERRLVKINDGYRRIYLTEFTGCIIFYTYRNRNEFLSYEAKFIDGKLKNISQLQSNE